MNEMTAVNTAETVLNENKENAPVIQENTAEPKKPYELRALCADDVFPIFSILSKIGIKEFKSCFDEENIEKLVGMISGENGNKENTLTAMGISLLPTLLDVANVLLSNIPKCETDIFKFLANISNLEIDQIRKLSMADLAEMIIDVVKKEEFKDFFKVVSKLFK